MNKSKAVRLPVHVQDSKRQLGRAMWSLTQKLGRRPNEEEIGLQMKVSTQKVQEMRSTLQQEVFSLDEMLGEHDTRSVGDLVHDKNVQGVEDGVIWDDTCSHLHQLLDRLNPMEHDIIYRRFGLGDGENQTLDDIGKIYNLSRERVRQIQVQGLRKMKRMCERNDISAA
jgi:RNA polymerase primary sigma factor